MSLSHGKSYQVYRMLPVSLQNLAVTAFGSIRWLHEQSGTFQNRVSRLMKMQWFEPEEMEAHRRDSLTGILLAAKHTDFYKDQLPGRLSILEDPFGTLARIPVLGKECVRSNPTRFLNRAYRKRLIPHGTSGTTGTPLQTYLTTDCIDMERALIWRQRAVTGLAFGESWRGMLGGHQVVPLDSTKPPFWRVNRLAKQVYFSTYHMTPENAPAYLEALKHFNITSLEGYPSALFSLAHSFETAGLSHQMTSVYYGAEPMHDFQRELVTSVFSSTIWDYYGLTEKVASASEFECRNGLHENCENCLLEIVDASGKPVAEGEYGELVGTSLSNKGFPLLRYRTGDMTRFLPGKCTCGRHSRRISRIDTKREDLLLMPDGSLLSASNLTFPFKEVGNILESQLFQDSLDHIEIRIVPAVGYKNADGEKLVSSLRAFIPGPVGLRLIKVDAIPRTGAGKFRFCVSKLTGKNESICE